MIISLVACQPKRHTLPTSTRFRTSSQFCYRMTLRTLGRHSIRSSLKTTMLSRKALGRNVPEDELNHLLGLLVIPVARNGFQTASRKAALFNLAEAMGVHCMPAHFYSPVPDVKAIPETAWQRRFDDTPGWELSAAKQLALLAELSRFAPELAEIPRKHVSADEFSWENPAFNETDASLYYAMIRHFRPQRVVEVGGGYSTMIASRACAQNGDTSLEVIEPYPMDVLTRPCQV